MPLIKNDKSNKARKSNIKKLIAEGYNKPGQAVAIAYKLSGEGEKSDGKKKKRDK